MAEQPRKGPGRPRKSVAVPDDAAQGQGAPSDDFGDGDAGKVGTSAPADSGGQGSWLAFEGRVIAETHKRGRGFVKVWHPEPLASVIHGQWPVSVEVGPEKV